MKTLTLDEGRDWNYRLLLANSVLIKNRLDPRDLNITKGTISKCLHEKLQISETQARNLTRMLCFIARGFSFPDNLHEEEEATKLKLPRWTEEENDILKSNLDKTDFELSFLLSKTPKSITRHRRETLGIKKGSRKRDSSLPPKECSVCHKIFIGINKFCSKECFKENHRKLHLIDKWKCSECGQEDRSRKSYLGICLDCLDKRKNHICQICKNPFRTRSLSIRLNCKFCESLRTCIYCKKSFSSKFSKYCSLDCKRKAMKRSDRPFPKCLTCGKEFLDSHNRGKRFCSTECYKQSRQKVWNTKRKGICIICHKEFQYHKKLSGNYFRGKYCSVKCRKDGRHLEGLKEKYSLAIGKAREKRWGKNYWTDLELKILVQNFKKGNTEDVAKLLPNRDKQTIRVKARRLGLYN